MSDTDHAGTAQRRDAPDEVIGWRMLTGTGAHYPSANGTASFDVGVVPPATVRARIR